MLVVVQSFFLSLSTDFSWFSIRPHPVFGDSTSAANRLEIPTVDFVCLFVFFSPTQFVCLFFWKTHTAPRSPFRSTSSVRPPRRAIGFYRVVPSLLLLLLLLLLLRSLVSSSVSRLVRFGSHIRPRESRPMIVIIYPTTPGATPRSFQIREEKRRDHREIERNRLRFVCVCFLSA